MTRLAFLGPSGTYSEAAALAHDPTAELLAHPTFTAAVEAVEGGQAEGAVCAIENALEGVVTETVDLLLREQMTLSICAEVVIPIHHVLAGAPGTVPAEATAVYSHPQALAQSRHTLARLAPRARPVAALSTAAAIEAALAEPGTLAVGNALAAQRRGGEIFAEDVSDEPGNETRFVVIAHHDHAPTGDDKTSIAFTTHHDRPGSLVEVLGELSTRRLNMTRIESRPTRRALGTYVFLVDFLGHRDDAVASEALRAVERQALWTRVLGSYPRWSGSGRVAAGATTGSDA